MTVSFKIDSKRKWLEACMALWKAGMLKELSVEDINLSEDSFPLEIPFDLGYFIELLSNPLVKPYKKKIDAALSTNLLKVIG